MSSSEPEDIFWSSLQYLYSYAPIHLSADPGSVFTHSGLTLFSPDTAASNWALHASSVWVASLYLANHLHDINLSPFSQQEHVDVLELGAGSGLPGILFAKRNGSRAFVTLSDYPDKLIMATLAENIARNNISPLQVKVIGHAWGQSTAELGVFDIVLAADTLWDMVMHVPLCHTLSAVLRQNVSARAYLVAGLHTGRWTIHRFLEKLELFGLIVEHIKERKVNDTDYEQHHPTDSLSERNWEVEREGEEETERRNWVVWIVAKWIEKAQDMPSSAH